MPNDSWATCRAPDNINNNNNTHYVSRSHKPQKQLEEKRKKNKMVHAIDARISHHLVSKTPFGVGHMCLWRTSFQRAGAKTEKPPYLS